MKPKEIDFKQVKKRAEEWIKLQDTHKHKYYHYFVGAIESWLGDVHNFSKYKTWVPTAKINIQVKSNEVKKVTKPHGMISITFSNKLYWKFLRELELMYKPYEVMLKYGFKGYSSGGRNGVFYLRKQDKNLIKAVDNLLGQSDHREAVFYELGLVPEQYDKLKKVKIVWHEPKGTRIVGVFNEEKLSMYFMDFAKY
jgi:hypothetical protein